MNSKKKIKKLSKQVKELIEMNLRIYTKFGEVQEVCSRILDDTMFLSKHITELKRPVESNPKGAPETTEGTKTKDEIIAELKGLLVLTETIIANSPCGIKTDPNENIILGTYKELTKAIKHSPKGEPVVMKHNPTMTNESGTVECDARRVGGNNDFEVTIPSRDDY